MTETNTDIAPISTETSVAETSSSNTQLLYGSIWLFSQLFGGAASYLIFSKQYLYWMEQNNPNNYSTGWNMWLTGWTQVFRYWYSSMFLQLGWTGFALLNYIFCLTGLDTAFNIFNILSIFVSLGNLALTSVIYYLYSTPGADYMNPDFGENEGDGLAFFGNIIASTQQLTISLLTLLAW